MSATTWGLGCWWLGEQGLRSGEELEEERNKKNEGENRRVGFGEVERKK